MSESQPPGDGTRPPGMPPPPAWPTSDADAVAGSTDQPQHVRWAVRLMYLGGVLSVISVFFIFGYRDTLRDQARATLERGENTATSAEVETLVNRSITLYIVAGVIAAGLWVLMGYLNNRGKAWARTMATVLGVLNVFLTVLARTITAAVSAILGIISIVLLWTQPSRAWFDRRRGRGRMAV